MEILDLYDKDRKLTGKTIVRGEDIPSGYYRLVVHVCLFNQKGELLIQKRKENKRGWPGLWDLSVGGCATHGEDSRLAAHRETLEEVGVHIDFDDRIPKFTLSFAAGFDDYYMLTYDVPISDFHPQEEEVDELKWVTYEELLTLVKKGEFVPYYFIEQIFDIHAISGGIYPDDYIPKSKMR